MDDITLIIVALTVLFLIFCLTVGFLLYTLGISKPIDVKAGPPPIKNAVVAYKFGKGPYKNSGKIFSEVSLLCPQLRCLGIYYDDPNKIPSEKLRYAVGIILSEGIVKVDPDVETRVLSEGYKIIKLPEVAHCVMTSFPYINTMSLFIAIWRVYPKLSEYIKSHKLSAYPMLEIYEPDAIQFMAPLSQQEKFFVSEALECVPEEYMDDLEGDQSLLSSSARSSPTQSERSSRSISTYSHSHVGSRYGDDTYTDDESDFESSINVTDDVNEEVQDNEISSSVEVRASKACTNLLEDSIEGSNLPEHEDEIDNISEEVKDGDNVVAGDASGIGEESVLHDSGICSGRVSINPNENDSMNDTKEVNVDGNDSSSSFEEIKMENMKEESAVEAAVKNEL